MFAALEAPRWEADGRDWPNREHSRFVEAGGISWHVQEAGAGEPLLLLHGTGASTHSFRDLLPILARDFRVIAPDLPGHGFTAAPRSEGLTLPGMARLVGALLAKLDIDPALAAGHSAGAAVLIAMSLQGLIRPRLLVSVNGALKPMRGAALFSPLAKLLFLNPLAPRLFARRALGADATRRLIEGTGSHIDARGLALYARLFQKSGHIASTLGMMAHWDLDRLGAQLPSLDTRLFLLAAEGDRAVPASDADSVKALVRNGGVVKLPYGGHLVHEEEPERIARLTVDAARETASPPVVFAGGGGTR